jgi:hypothetical protein
MIYIGTTGNNGSAIYFDIHSAERQGRGMRFSGTVGDGCYEGEALVETGRCESVTFADAWLGGSGFSEFIERCGLTILEEALLESVREMSFSHSRRSQPHGYSGTTAPSMISETSPSWSSGAS